MTNKIKLFTVVSILVFLQSCLWRSNPDPVVSLPNTSYTPTLMSRTLLESSISSKPPRDIVNAGKIYLYGDFIFVNEKYKGFHVIDNSNDSLPTTIGFINVPGSLDMAIKSNTIYVDNATDLVSIDVSKLDSIKVTKRIVDAFFEPISPDGRSYTKTNEEKNAIIVGWSLAN